MTMNKALATFVACAGMTVAGAAFSQAAPQQPPPPPQPAAGGGTPTSADAPSNVPSFAELDKDHKGKLSRSDIPKDVEGLKPLRAHFKEADKDGNGTLSPAEYGSYTQSPTPGASNQR